MCHMSQSKELRLLSGERNTHCDQLKDSYIEKTQRLDDKDVSGLRTFIGLRQAQETRKRLLDNLRKVCIFIQARHHLTFRGPETRLIMMSSERIIDFFGIKKMSRIHGVQDWLKNTTTNCSRSIAYAILHITNITRLL